MAKNDFRRVKKLGKYLKKERKRLILILLILIPVALVGAIQPLLVGQAISVLRGEDTIPFFDNLSDKRQEAIVNLVFNMGLSTFCKFKKTISYIEQGLFELAGTELLDSNYARQVGQRSKDVAIMLAEG